MSFLSRLFGRKPGFAERLIAAFRRRPDVASVVHDKAQRMLKVVFKDGQDQVVNLPNLEIEYGRRPESEREAWIESLASLGPDLELPEDLQPARRWLVNAQPGRHPLSPGLDGIGLQDLCRVLAEQR